MSLVMRLAGCVALASLTINPSQPVAAQAEAQVDTSFDGYLQLVAARARGEGISEYAISTTLAGLTPNQRVIDLDRAQPGTPSRPGVYPLMSRYISRHVDSARINGGKRTFAANRETLRQVEAEYGVPGEILTAIWGHETNYGSFMGSFDLARSLATLAWEGRRRDLFEGELIALMKMVDRGVSRSQLTGSWAGAFGNPQFLPSVYLRLAVDGDGDGDRDIWNSRVDTLHSMGNYFKAAGWQPGLPWAVRATVPASLDRGSLKSPLRSPVCPRVHERHSVWKTVAEWRELGVYPYRSLPDETMVSLFEPDGPDAPKYLLTGNYRVILEYNCSNYYAMSVGLLADEINQ